MKLETSPTESVWPHRIAVLLACAVFPLIWVGSLVTTYNAGMAVPDWPGTYGYNLFLYPWETWLYGPWDLFIEHGHRLLGALVGMITIALVAVVWFTRSPRWLLGLSFGALLLVIAQGVLGGARVLLDERLLAMVHGCVGPLFFAYCAVIAVVTSRWWKDVAATTGGDNLKRFALLTCGLSYFQLILGAQLRHLGADTPFRALVAFHVLTAFILAGHAFLLAGMICWWRFEQSSILWPAVTLCILVTAQIGFGVGAWVVNYSWPNLESAFPQYAGYTIEAEGRLQTNVVTLHVATGSLILATSAVLVARCQRLFGQAFQPQMNIEGQA